MYLAFAMGLALSIGRMGSALGGVILPAIFNASDENLFVPLIVAAIGCLISMGTTFITCVIDFKAERKR